MKYFLSIILVFSVLYVEAQTKMEELRTLSNNVSNNEDREDVIKKATKLIKKDNTISEVFEIRARAYEWLDKDKCVADYEMAVQLDSTNVNAHIGLGNIFSELERYDEALEQFELGLKHGGYIGILLNVANLYEKTLNYEGWERTALRMIEPQMDGTNRQFGYVSLARFYKSKGAPQKALDNYNQACKIGSPDASYLYQTALLLIELDRKNEACYYLQKTKFAYDYEYCGCDDVPELIKNNCTK